MREEKCPLETNHQGETNGLIEKTHQCNYNPLSTSTHNQQQKILALLSIRPHSTNELREMGIMSPATRVKELRNKGYNITTIKKDMKIGSYFYKNIAHYVLHGGAK